MSHNIFQPDTYRGLIYFMWAGVMQISGAYLVWSSMRNNHSIAMVIVSGAMVIASALVMGLQQTGFVGAYTTYGGMLALMALMWRWHCTCARPDIIELVGGIMVLGGIGILVLTPRH